MQFTVHQYNRYCLHEEPSYQHPHVCYNQTMQDISNYEKIRQDSENFYRKIGKIACPAFKNELVYFTSEGFNHLIFKGNRTERTKHDQITKLKLLGRAIELVRIATTYQEYEESIKEFTIKKFKQRVRESKIVKYWGLIAIMNSFKIKVIVRQVGDNGQRHFWSVIPNWVTSQYRDMKLRSHMKGNPDDD